MKSSYRVKEIKDEYKMSYTGDLAEALEKAKTDLDKRQGDPNMQHWKWIKEKATKEIQANQRAIERIKVFIRTAERQLRENEVKENG